MSILEEKASVLRSEDIRHFDNGDFISSKRQIDYTAMSPQTSPKRATAVFNFDTPNHKPTSSSIRNSNASSIMFMFDSVPTNQNSYSTSERRTSTASSFAKRLSCAFSRPSNGNESQKRGNLTALLCDAAARGDIQFMGRILGAGGALTKKNKDGLTPLHVAAIAGQPESVRCLVRMGADVSSKDNSGYTALHRAVLNQHVHLIAQLVNLGANVDEKTSDGRTALHIAAELPDALNTSRPTSVSSTGSNSAGNLRFSYAFGKSECQRFSTASSPDLRSQINVALIDNSYDMCNTIEALVRAGANVEITDKKGDTPLHAAARANRTRSIETLISLGASMNTRNTENKTALSILASNDDLNTVASRVLLEKGATISPISPVEVRKFNWAQSNPRAVL